MKKGLALILILAMFCTMFLMIGCAGEEAPAAGGTETPAADGNGTAPPATTPEQGVQAGTEAAVNPDAEGEITQEMLDNSLPCQYVPEKIAAGMDVVVGWSLNNLNGVGAAVDARLKEELPKMGLSYVIATDEGDTAAQINNIENFITMGCAAIMIHTTDIALLEEVVGKAEEAGCACILYGDVPKYYMSAYTSTDLAALGYGAGLIVRSWIDMTYPDAGEGEIEVAFHGFYVVMPTVIVSDMVKQAILDDPRCTIVYEEENVSGIDAGYTFAERAMSAFPNVKVFAGYNLLASYGMNNYIMGLPNVDPSKYCVVGTTYDADIEGFIANTEAGNGCWVGTTAGDPDPAWGHLECLRAVLFENQERPVVRMQEVKMFGIEGIEIADYMDQYYYGVHDV